MGDIIERLEYDKERATEMGMERMANDIKDAIEAIENLRRENKIVGENCDELDKQRADFAMTIAEMKLNVERQLDNVRNALYKGVKL